MAITINFIVSVLIAIGCSRSSPLDAIEIADNCYGKICWRPEDYPAQEIMDRLQEENMRNFHTFGDYETPNFEVSPFKESSCNLCIHKNSLRISPLTLKDNGDIYYVVRTQNYQQNITLNICAPEKVQNQDSKCIKTGRTAGSNDETMTCEQKYTVMKLLVYDPKLQKFTERSLQYPSACACVIKRNQERD